MKNMRDSSPHDKVGYTIGSRSPCTAPEGCTDEDDFDPCGSNDDLTEKDLAVILKEEAAKLKQKEVESVAKTAKSLGAIHKEKSINKLDEVEQAGKTTEEKKETAEESQAEETEEEEEEEEEHRKKKVCKKFIKNPFFTNRLKFTSDLPPRPPTPPAQMLPPLEEVDSKGKIICANPKRKCRKRRGDDFSTGSRKGRTRSGEEERVQDDKEGKNEDGKEDTEERNEEEQVTNEGASDVFNEETSKDFDEETDDLKNETSENTLDDAKGSKRGESEKDRKRAEKDRRKAEKDRKKEKKAEEERKKKQCGKKSEKPLCKKKVSDVSISLMPPQIPPLQRDLPETSPKDIPEVERQILLTCGKIDKKCKKQTPKCKAK